MNLPATEDLLIEERAGVLTITINRPHKRNAMNDAVVGGIMQAFDAIADRRDIRAVVLQGAGGHFCSGGDISGMKETSSAEEAEKAAWEFNRVFGRMCTQVNRAPQVVITMLEGAVLDEANLTQFHVPSRFPFRLSPARARGESLTRDAAARGSGSRARARGVPGQRTIAEGRGHAGREEGGLTVHDHAAPRLVVDLGCLDGWGRGVGLDDRAAVVGPVAERLSA